MPDSHALLKFKVVQILQTYAVFKRNIIKSSMFKAPLILALGIYTSNPCKSSCTFQNFFMASLFTYLNIWLLPVNPSDTTHQIPTTLIFKRFPEIFMSMNHSLSPTKGYPISVPESSIKCTCLPFQLFQNWRNGMWHFRKTVNDNGNIQRTFLLKHPKSLNPIRWRPTCLFP